MQRPRDSLRVLLSRLRAEPQAPWVHINLHSLVPPTPVPPAQGVPRQPRAISWTSSQTLYLCPPLYNISFVSTCVVGLYHFHVLSVPSVCLSFSLPIYLFNCLWLSLCLYPPLSVSPFFLCPLPPSSSVFFSVYLFVSPDFHLSLLLSCSSLILQFSFPSSTLSHSSRTRIGTNPWSHLFPASGKSMAGKKLRPLSLGAPQPCPPSQDSLLPRSQQPLWPPSDKTYLLPQGRPELA